MQFQKRYKNGFKKLSLPHSITLKPFPMLSNLDNEVVFKKAFTDKVVFQCFVKDILSDFGDDLAVHAQRPQRTYLDG
ncbi:MAG: hypothetical protein RL329_366 [Bacteroidota bacterium]|jgi:hypothetical protein